jgi:ABC-type multidrug transport system ATPase subunit
VLIASHVLSEIERIASRVMILLDGRLLTTDALGREAPAPDLEQVFLELTQRRGEEAA